MGNRLFEEILHREVPLEGGEGPSLQLLDEVWLTLVGDDLAMKIQPLGWQKGELSVLVIDSTWHEALRRQQGRLRARIQRFFPWPITRIQWTVAREDEPRFARSLQAAPSRTSLDAGIAEEHTGVDDLCQDLRESLAIFDDETRERLLAIRVMAARLQQAGPVRDE